MNIEYHQHYSSHLNRNMELKRYGHDGKVIIVFPSSGGRFYEYEDFKMIEAIAHYIEKGAIQVFSIDSIDNESWLAQHHDLDHKSYMAEQFEQYLITEFIPFVKHQSDNFGPFMATGCSMGAYHAVNMALKHPDVFDQVVALSGIYDARFFVGEYYGHPKVYANSPVDYLWQLEDDWFLERMRKNKYIIAVGQGQFEEPSIKDTKALEAAFQFKHIDAWFDYWGHDVKHDWEWWRNQMPYFLDKLGY